MGCHRAAIVNMSSVSASMQLVQANEMFLKVYPYRIAKVGDFPRAEKGLCFGYRVRRALVANVYDELVRSAKE